MVAAEVLLAVVLQDRTLGEYVASRDPVSGSVYLAMLALFAVMPLGSRASRIGFAMFKPNPSFHRTCARSRADR
ncbi:MAG: hypothetical protein MZW92_27450 [Comamonadaceae bacterium]|nr:hypothetical protein [Comamonadaceae bacterium]